MPVIPSLALSVILLTLSVSQTSFAGGDAAKVSGYDGCEAGTDPGEAAAQDPPRAAGVRSYLSDEPRYILPHLLVGGTGGTERGALHDYANGGVLREISVWVSTIDSEDMYCLVMVNATFSSGATFTVGSEANSPMVKSFTFEEGERIRQLSLWGNGKRTVGGRVAAIQFLTDKGRKFDQGVPLERRGLEEQFVGEDLGSGIVVGLHARSALAIDALAFYFLRPIQSASIDVDDYPGLALAPLEGKPSKVASAVFMNSYTHLQPMNLTAVGNVTTYHKWLCETASATFHQTQFSVVAPVPIVTADSGRAKWAKSSTTAFDANERVVDEELSLVFNVTLDPNERWEACATAVVYEIRSPLRFRGHLSLKTENDGVWRFPVSGTYTGSAFAGPTVSDASLLSTASVV